MHRDYQPETTPELLLALEKASQQDSRSGKATKRSFEIFDSDKRLVGWKFKEWEYGTKKAKLPSDARGLFTLEGEDKIVIRGYDKFFNIGEVYYTGWDWLEENTQGPYFVTAKENGCIILISGLEDGTLVVCSKHSTGPRADIDRNHALYGQNFLKSQLKLKNIDPKEFALKLYELNVTAVAEYCDDDFEEHIVEYKGDQAGLYLHGLNLNQPIFETYPIEKVEEFASTYGFKTIDFFQKDNIDDLRKILEECSKTGSYNNKEMEGFVIRCKIKGKNEDYFFKFKFEEPYLMYRQWREVTREYIQKRKRSELNFKKHRFITNNYLDFIIPLLENDEKLRSDYLNGHGIIELRQKFLNHYGKSGSEILNQELLDQLDQLNLSEAKVDKNTKFVLIPVATIGCGKTTTGFTLCGLDPNNWGIVINDDLPKGGDSVKVLVSKSLDVLQTKQCVIIDKNHHQIRERRETLGKLKELNTNNNIKYICLNFSKAIKESEDIWDVTTKRVIERGDNHQSIKVTTNGEDLAKKIMSGFLQRFNPINIEKEPDSQFDLIIDLEVNKNNSSLNNAKLILAKLKENYPLAFDQDYTNEQFEESFQKALNYKPTFTKTFNNKKTDQKQKDGTKRRKPVYFSIDIKNVSNFLEKIETLLTSKNINNSIYSNLKINNRIQNEFHVTLAHVNQSKGTPEQKQLWKDYIDYQSKHRNGFQVSASLILDSLIWNDNIMTVLITPLAFTNDKTKEILDFKCGNKFPHITIGTSTSDIKPYYSNTLAEIASKYEGKEGVYDDVTIVNFEEGVVLQKCPIIVNY